MLPEHQDKAAADASAGLSAVGTAPTGLLLAHGSSGSADHHTLAALDEHLDIPVHRMEFPYRRAGRRDIDTSPPTVAAVPLQTRGPEVPRPGAETDRGGTR